jgi:hypothetical protein
MRVKEIYKTMREESLRIPVSTLNNRQLRALLKKDRVEMSGDTDYLIYRPESKKPDYCLNDKVDICRDCYLVNYGRDCRNNQIEGK